MSDFTLLSSEVCDFTAEVAQRFANMDPTPTERDLDPNRVKFLKQKIVDGLAVPFHLADVKVKALNKVFRANGQHTSKAATELDGTLPAGLKAHIDHFEVNDLHGAVMLFRQIDARQSARSSSDVSGTYQRIVPEVAEIRRDIGKLVADGIVWWRQQVEGVPTLTGDDAYDLFQETGLHGFIRWAGLEVLDMKTPEMRAVPVVAAMYATFIRSDADARTFWDSVKRNGVQFEDQHPTTVLDAWLKRIKDPKDDLTVKRGEHYQGCIYAWNAYRSDSKPIKDIKYDVRKGFLTPL